MGHEPASTPGPPSQDEKRGAEGAEHPEARGFGSHRRWGKEIVLTLALVLGLPLALLWGARDLAAWGVTRLPPSTDAKLGRPTWEALQVSGQRCADRAAERYAQGLMASLVSALGETPFEFELMLVDSPEVNAFALPGGYVVVNSGLLAEAKSGEEVAAVLAHELSHVTLRHSTKRLAGSLGASAALALVLGGVDLGAPAYTLAHLAGLKYERDQEREADEEGRRLLMRAGISPLGMATFFERLSASVRPPELISTHPDPGDRAQQARRAAENYEARITLPAPEGVGCAPPK